MVEQPRPDRYLRGSVIGRRTLMGGAAFTLSSIALGGVAHASERPAHKEPSGRGGARCHKRLVRAIVISMGTDGATVTDSQYDQYFKQGTALAGVQAVIQAGKFLINGYPIPGTEAEFRQQTPGGYMVNQVNWVYYDTSAETWMGGYHGQTASASYPAAALAAATGIVAGLEVRLYDVNGDGYVDLIEADYQEATVANRITWNRDRTISVYRGDIDTANKTPYEGRTFDGTHFSATSGEKIKVSDFDPRIRTGDITLFWYGTSGWAMKRPKQVRGMFVTGEDHVSYNIDGHVYQDAMRFSRDNVFISNRPGEFTDAQKYFGLNNNPQGLRVSLWLVPTTDPTAQGAPIALTSDSSARPFLASAIAQTRTRLSSVFVSEDGSDVPTNEKWVTPAVATQLSEAIARAQAALTSRSSSASLIDYQTYLLYLNLDGGSDDIGARFAGFNYVGFENEVQAGNKHL